MPVPASWHPGQLIAQTRQGWADDVPPPPYIFHPSIDDHYSTFFAQLEFVPLTTLDARNRPWVSLLSGKDGAPGFVRPVQIDGVGPALEVRARVPQGTPLHARFQDARTVPQDEPLRHPNGRPLAAAVGVMLHNRRRNKLNGFIQTLKHTADDEVVMTLGVDTTCGNCPKYINLRQLQGLPNGPAATVEAFSFDVPNGEQLPDAAIEVIRQADIVFLGTRHQPRPRSDPAFANESEALFTYRTDGDDARLGCNHRGGRPGFLRTYFDETTGRTCIVLPDYSGNRFMESIGNMVIDPVASLAIPRFVFQDEGRASDVLHVTGSAEVLFGEDASREIRGVKQVTKIWVEGYSLVRNALPVVAQGAPPAAAASRTLDERIGWSPYNPQIKLVAKEVASGADASQSGPGADLTAKLTRVQIHTSTLGSFTWRISRPTAAAGPLPTLRAGQHVIMDMSAHADSRLKMYSHMARHRGGEKDLNDDGVRSWTVSRVEQETASDTSDKANSLLLTTTLRRVDGGAVTSQLFNRARVAYETTGKVTLLGQPTLQSALASGASLPPIDFTANVEAPVLGFGGEFTVPLSGAATAKPLRLAYIVNGIGVTPYLAHLQELAALATSADRHRFAEVTVMAVVCCREGEASAIWDLVRGALRAGTPSAVPDDAAKLTVTTVILEKGSPSSASSSSEPLPSDGVSRIGAADVFFRHIRSARIGADALLVNADEAALPAAFNLRSSLSVLDAKQRADLLPAADVLNANAVFVCGTEGFERVVRTAVQAREQEPDADGRKANILTESFNF